MEYSNMQHSHQHNSRQDPAKKDDGHSRNMPGVDHNGPTTHTGHHMAPGREDHHIMMINDFKNRFYVVLILTVPIMLLSQMIQHWLSIHWQFPGSGYILFGLSTFVFIYGG